MLEHGFYNMDCMEGMKEFPDNYFNLAVVDPPYGSGHDGGIGTDSENASTGTSTRLNRGGGVARETEVPPRYTTNGRTAGSRTEHGVTRTGGTWATKYAKKLLRGM